jgi:hypothetical protein
MKKEVRHQVSRVLTRDLFIRMGVKLSNLKNEFKRKEAITWPLFYASPHELRTRTGDGRNLVVLSGYADFHLRGTGGSWRCVIGEIVRGPVWRRLDDVAPIVSLASISNKYHAVNAGRAVDWCTWSYRAGRIYLRCKLCVRDVDGYLHRVAYQITAVGIL